MSTGMTKGGRDFLLLGDFNVMCAYCGRKRKASELKRDNDFARGLWCCPEHADDRHPQEYARGVKENMAAPFVQPPIIAFVQLPLGFPIAIVPSPVVLMPSGPLAIVTQPAGFALVTEGTGQALVTEVGSNYTAYVTVKLPPWVALGPSGDPSTVTVDSIEWSWAIGGVGIQIVNPTGTGTQLAAVSLGGFGKLSVTVTDSLGGISMATTEVTG